VRKLTQMAPETKPARDHFLVWRKCSIVQVKAPMEPESWVVFIATAERKLRASVEPPSKASHPPQMRTRLMERAKRFSGLCSTSLRARDLFLRERKRG
jgi:hypothetical protein